MASHRVNTRDLLQKHWNQLAENLDAESTANKLYDEEAITREEVKRIRAANSKLEQARELLTILEDKSIDDFLVFAKILTRQDGSLVSVGKSILQAANDSQTNDVNRKISMASKDVACQTEAIDAGRREHFQSGDSRPVVTVISVGVAGLVGAIIIHLVMRNDYLQKSVSALEKSVLEYERVIANLTELSRASSSLEESRDRLLEERLQLMSLIDGMNINLTKQTTASSLLEQEKRSLEENLTDVSHVVQRLSVKLSKVVAENRDLKRRRLFSRQCVGTRTARLNQCVESLKEAASTSEKEQETLLSENTKLKNEIAAMTLKLSDAVQARDKLLDETKQLKQKLEETLKRLETGEGRRCGGKHGHGKHGHGHHHHHHGHHGKRGRGKCGRR